MIGWSLQVPGQSKAMASWFLAQEVDILCSPLEGPDGGHTTASVYFFSLSRYKLKFSLPPAETLKTEDPFGSVSLAGQSSCTGAR